MDNMINDIEIPVAKDRYLSSRPSKEAWVFLQEIMEYTGASCSSLVSVVLEYVADQKDDFINFMDTKIYFTNSGYINRTRVEEV